MGWHPHGLRRRGPLVAVFEVGRFCLALPPSGPHDGLYDRTDGALRGALSLCHYYAQHSRHYYGCSPHASRRLGRVDVLSTGHVWYCSVYAKKQRCLDLYKQLCAHTTYPSYRQLVKGRGVGNKKLGVKTPLAIE